MKLSKTINQIVDFVKYKFIEVPIAELRHMKYTYQYGTSCPDFDRLMYIDPSKIKYGLMTNSFKGPGMWIVGGDWDLNRSKKQKTITCYSNRIKYNKLIQENPWQLYLFENWDHYKSYVQRFRKGVPWEETEFYENLTKNPEKNSGKYRPREEIKPRLKKDEKLYSSIRKHGFLTQRELADEKESFNHHYKDNELGVGITRSGEMIYIRNGACHRLAIAKILDLDSIPVRVKVRHKEWQQKRKAINNVSSVSELETNLKRHLSHPDMQDIAPPDIE